MIVKQLEIELEGNTQMGVKNVEKREGACRSEMKEEWESRARIPYELARSNECIGWTAGRASRLQTSNKNILRRSHSPKHRLPSFIAKLFLLLDNRRQSVAR